MPPEQMALMIPIIAVFIPIVAIWTSHARKMAEIKAMQGQTVAPDIRRELTEIKQQISELRDTTTRFDLSFDAAMTRLEQRVDNIETTNVAPIPLVPQRVTMNTATDTEPVILQTRGR